MNLWMKSGLALVAGLAVGGGVGVVHASRTIGRSASWMSQWAAGAQYARLADLQYRYADEAHARAALADFLNFAQQIKDVGKVSDPRTLGIDVALAYMRLAALDRQDGNTDSYRSNVSRAQEALRAVGVQRTSVDEMEKFLSQRDSDTAKTR
jgi:hypothetical protein